MTIPVSKVVRVSILTSPTFPARKGFGLLLIIGNSSKLPTGQRIRFYSDMDAVAEDFSSTDEEYKAAQVAFSQSPRPSEIAIGRRFSSAVAGELLGSTTAYEDTIATWAAITTGSMKISIDGVEKTLTSMDFSAVTTLSGVASVVQTKLAAAATGSTVTFDGTRFIVRSGTTGTSSAVSYASAHSSGVDVSGMLGLTSADSGVITAGAAAETIASTLDALQNYNASWYGFHFTSEVTDQNIKDAAAWAEARVKIYGWTRSTSGIADGGVTNDLASDLKASGYRRTFGVWDSDDAYAAISAMARAFVVNFNMQNSTLTLKFKTLPGITPSEITESQRLALVSKNANYYTYFGESRMLAEGVMADGTFFDEVHGLDWLQNAIETNVFGFIYTRVTKVSQTDKGVASLVQQVEKACQEAVNNGLSAPGVWNGSPVGEVETGDFLPRGYYVYAQPVAEQNQSDREARKAPPIQVLLKGAGAIHSCDISVEFGR